MKDIEEALIELAVSALGWAVCMAMLSGAFALGFASATWWGRFDPTTAGLLSAIAFVWLYEHRISHSRWEKLNDRLDAATRD